MVPLLGTEFVPKADFSETTRQFLHPRGLLAGGHRGQGAAGREASCASCQRCATRWHYHQHRHRSRARCTPRIYVRLVDRKDRSRSVDAMSSRAARNACSAMCPASPSPTWGLTGPGGRAISRLSSRCRGQTFERTGAPDAPRCASKIKPHPRPGGPGFSSAKPDKPTIALACASRDVASATWALSRGTNWPRQLRTLGGWHHGGQLARSATTRPTTSTCAWRLRPVTRPAGPGAPALRPRALTPMAPRASCRLNQAGPR
jgi:hypothetical protein